MLIHEILDKKLPSGFIGLEIETETPSWEDYKELIDFSSTETFDPTKKFRDTFGKYWTMVEDGSLRNFGVEWVFKRPMGLIAAKNALNVFAEETKDIPFLQDQPGTSVHVHLSTLDMTPRQAMSFVFLLFMFENLLTEFCGPGRRANLFALPSRVAYGNLTHFKMILRKLQAGQSNPFYADQEDCKYAAINLASLWSLGTAEVRCHPGCTDVERIKLWIDLLVDIRNYAMTGDPSRYLNEWEDSPGCLIHDVFGIRYGYMSPPNYQALVDRNVFTLHHLVDGIDWSIYGMAYETNKIAMEEQNAKYKEQFAKLFPVIPPVVEPPYLVADFIHMEQSLDV